MSRINTQLAYNHELITDDTIDTTDISKAVITWEIVHFNINWICCIFIILGL